MVLQISPVEYAEDLPEALSICKRLHMLWCTIVNHINWIYSIVCFVLVVSDFFRSSLIASEIAQIMKLQDHSQAQLNGSIFQMYQPSYMKFRTDLLQDDPVFSPSPKFRRMITFSFASQDFTFFTRVHPIGKTSGNAFISELSHRIFIPEVKGTPSNYSSYVRSGYIKSLGASKLIIKTLHGASVYLSTDEKLYKQGNLLEADHRTGFLSAELYQVEAGSSENFSYSMTLLVDIQTSHYVADGLRMFGTIVIWMLCYKYLKSFCYISVREYMECNFSIYDIITGNRIVALSMGLATLLDFDLTISILSRTSLYAFYTWKLHPIYYSLMYGYRLFWVFNFLALVHGIIVKSSTLRIPAYGASPFILTTRKLYAVGLGCSVGMIAYKQITELVSPEFPIYNSSWKQAKFAISESYTFQQSPVRFTAEAALIFIAFAALSIGLQHLQYSCYPFKPHESALLQALFENGMICTIPAQYWDKCLTQRQLVAFPSTKDHSAPVIWYSGHLVLSFPSLVTANRKKSQSNPISYLRNNQLHLDQLQQLHT